MANVSGDRQNLAGNPKEGFFKKNRSLVIMLPILAILVVVVIVVYSGVLGTGSPAAPDSQATQANAAETEATAANEQAKVEVLPQPERIYDSSKKEVASTATKDPFKGPMRLDGILVGEEGNSVAIITAGGGSYIVKVNDLVAGTWKVTGIDSKSVMLESGEKNVTLELVEKN